MYDVVWIHVQPAHNGSAWSKQIQVLGLVLAEIRKMKGLHTFALFEINMEPENAPNWKGKSSSSWPFFRLYPLANMAMENPHFM